MSAATPLADLLLAKREAQGGGEDRASLEGLLRGALERAREAWPGVKVSDESFVAHLAERLPEDGSAVDLLPKLCLEDLFLAHGCVLGSDEAVIAFEAQYGADIVRSVQKARIPGVAADEVAQAVRAQILVGDGKSPPRITQYTGRGDLRGWLRVVAVREALMRLRARRREVQINDGHLAQLVHDDSDPEIAHLKTMYRDDFKTSLGEALAALDSRDRNLLRYHYLERVSLDRLAVMHQVHRVTISRWLLRAREQVIEGTLAALRKRIPVSETEFQSLVRLLQSRAEVSVRLLMED